MIRPDLGEEIRDWCVKVVRDLPQEALTETMNVLLDLQKEYVPDANFRIPPLKVHPTKQ